MRYLCSAPTTCALQRGFFAHAYFAYRDIGGISVKEIKAFKDALHTASNGAAKFMTSHLQAEATASGWPSDITSRMKVTHNNGSFDVHVNEKHYAKALDLEYGTPDTQPTAAIRRFGNRTGETENFIIGHMSRFMRDL